MLSYKISFEYPEQKKFPPKKDLLYDVESFLNLRITFIFTKKTE
jgi:hypothetical protein